MVEVTASFREIDIGYIAGLFEGEGSVINTKSNGTGWGLEICMTDREPLERIQSIFGGKIGGPYKRGKDHWKETFNWRINGFKRVEEFYNLTKHLLSPRRIQQFEKVLSVLPANFAYSMLTCGRGSIAGMTRHRKRKELPCLMCRIAQNKYIYERRNPGRVFVLTSRVLERYPELKLIPHG